MTNEDLDMILNAGLEKIAYEEGLNDYADSLEKVAGVHGTDAMDLHDFLEKVAEEERLEYSDEGRKRAKKMALLGGTAGGAIGGAIGGKMGGGNSAIVPGGLLGTAGGAALSYAGAGPSLNIGENIANMKDGSKLKNFLRDKRKEEIKRTNEKAKTAGVDDDTLNYLFEKGLEALTE